MLELSIVLVIIGLIVGGITVGSSMIRAAELRAVTTEFMQFQAATHTFRDKYFAAPGDMPNAIDFWGAAHATAATCLTTVGTGTQTCNGNGDGWIDEPAAASQYGESLTYWQQLVNAGLISGDFDGRAGALSRFDAALETTLPASKVSGVGWSSLKPLAYSSFAGDSAWFALDYGHFFSLGAKWTGSWTWGAAFTPAEVWNIDKKLDDGRPGTGKVIVGIYEPCTDRTAGQSSAAHAEAAEYDLTNEDIACGVIFRKVM